MKERPILFSGDMVRAILDGKKTMTRRIIKPQPFQCDHKLWPDSSQESVFVNDDLVKNQWHCSICGNGIQLANNKLGVKGIKCPYGQPGDRLWVREKTRLIASVNDPYRKVRFRYEADGFESDWLVYPDRLKPITIGQCVANGCYREASRITLEIGEVKVERLQDITPEEAREEGCCCLYENSIPYQRLIGQSFEAIWDKLYANWDFNPWVWVIKFHRIQ